MKAEILSVMGKTPLNTEVIRDKVFARYKLFYQVDTVSRELRGNDNVVATPFPNKGRKGFHHRWSKISAARKGG